MVLRIFCNYRTVTQREINMKLNKYAICSKVFFAQTSKSKHLSPIDHKLTQQSFNKLTLGRKLLIQGLQAAVHHSTTNPEKLYKIRLP